MSTTATSTEKPNEGLTDRLKRLRQLVQLALHDSSGYEIRDATGYATSVLIERCGIPDNATNRKHVLDVLADLVASGTVVRDLRDSNKRTYLIAVVKHLPDNQAKAIRRRRAEIQVEFGGVPVITEEDLSLLHKDCERGLAAMLTAMRSATVRSPEGMASISVTQVFYSISIGKSRGAEIRHYLKLFRLIAGIKRSDVERGWWWSATPGVIDKDALREAATGPQRFVPFSERQSAKRSEQLVTTRRVEDPAPSQSSGSTVAKTAAPQTAKSAPKASTEEVGIIAELLAKLDSLQAEYDRLQEAHSKCGPQEDDLLTRARALVGRRDGRG